jgi:DNA end-binding protein Ku
MPARAIGTATISFGLVSIPIKLYTTSESGTDVSFNMLHGACGSRLKQQYICTKDGEVVERDQMVKGYEFTKGQYVVLSGRGAQGARRGRHQRHRPHRVRAGGVGRPAAVREVVLPGPRQGRRARLPPDQRGDDRERPVGIASYSARGKQYVVAVRPFQNGLIMHQLRYADEVKAWSRGADARPARDQASELALARQIISQITVATFDNEKYKDDVKARMLELIQGKIDGQEITAAPEAPQGKIIDLMEALKASLGMAAPAAQPAKAAEAAPVEAVDAKKKSRKKSA